MDRTKPPLVSKGGFNNTEGTDFGQSRCGHPDVTNFGQSIFDLGFGPANVGQNQFMANPFLANPIGSVCVSWWGPEGWDVWSSQVVV